MDNEVCGVITVNKHKGVTSHDIVFKIRKLFGTKKAGHTGTLDPLAEGVLPVLLGRAAKAAEYLVSDDKIYKTEIKLGVTTDTEDITGKVIEAYSGPLPEKTELFNVCSEFIGEIDQTPPMYSALKVEGKKLVDLARAGIEIERASRKIKIKSIHPEVIDEKEGIYSLTVECSKGTYIRTLCSDIGKKLGCGASMKALKRLKSGNFVIENSYTIEEMEKMSLEERMSLLKPAESLFLDFDNVVLPDFYAGLLRNGCEIYQQKIQTAYPVDTFLRISDKNGFFALGKIKEYESGTAVKALKLFVL